MNFDNRDNEIVLLVERAMRNDDAAWEEIYEKTNRYTYYMALKFLRSEQDAQDITQEVYIKMMRSISQLSSAESFYGWLRSIIYSKCKDLVKKKKPVLLDEDEDGGSLFEDIPDLNEEFLPAKVLDNDETRRMVLELVDALPYLQRQTVMFFYYDEMKVEQIAKLMECALGTVKSRLNYARQQIKQGVEEYERKGIKLYGMGALPILTILLREEAENLFIPQLLAGGIASVIGHTAGTGAGAAKASIPLLTKVIVGAIAGSVIIGSSVLLLINNNDPQPITASTEIISSPTEIISPDEEQVQNLDVILTAEQLALLLPLENAVLEYDMNAAFPILASAEFQEICRNLPKEHGNIYKRNEYGEWRLAYYPQPNDDTSNYQISVCTNWNNGFVYLAESYRRSGKIEGGYMTTYDITNGKVDGNAYNSINVNIQ